MRPLQGWGMRVARGATPVLLCHGWGPCGASTAGPAPPQGGQMLNGHWQMLVPETQALLARHGCQPSPRRGPPQDAGRDRWPCTGVRVQRACPALLPPPLWGLASSPGSTHRPNTGTQVGCWWCSGPGLGVWAHGSACCEQELQMVPVSSAPDQAPFSGTHEVGTASTAPPPQRPACHGPHHLQPSCPLGVPQRRGLARGVPTTLELGAVMGRPWEQWVLPVPGLVRAEPDRGEWGPLPLKAAIWPGACSGQAGKGGTGLGVGCLEACPCTSGGGLPGSLTLVSPISGTGQSSWCRVTWSPHPLTPRDPGSPPSVSLRHGPLFLSGTGVGAPVGVPDRGTSVQSEGGCVHHPSPYPRQPATHCHSGCQVNTVELSSSCFSHQRSACGAHPYRVGPSSVPYPCLVLTQVFVHDKIH